MNFRKSVGLFTVLFFWNVPGHTADKVSALSLEEVIQTALTNNRDLKIAAFEIERTKARHRWAGRLSNPTLNISGSNDFAGLDDDESNFQIGFAQKFPLTHRLRNEREVRRVQVLLAETEMAENRRLMAYETHQLAVEFLAAKTSKAAQSRLIRLNREITDFLQKQVGIGEASRLDVTQMALNGRALVRQVGRLDVKMLKLRLALNRRLNFPPDRKVTIKGNLAVPATPPPAKYTLNAALQRRPDYLALLVKENVARAEIILQNSNRWDDIGMNLFAQRQRSVDDPIGLETNTFLGLGVSIPLPLRLRNQAGIEIATINKEAVKREISAREFEIQNELASAIQERSFSWKLARDSTGHDLKLAHDNFADFRKAYENAQVSIVQVQRAQEQLLQLATAAVSLQREFHLADANVRFVRGAYANLRTPSGEGTFEEGTKAQRHKAQRAGKGNSR